MENLELLQRAKEEIIILRSQNQIMAARLGVFDDMMMLLKSSPVYPSYGAMHPDIVYEIDKAVGDNKKENQS